MLTKGKKEDLLELDKLAVLVINDMKKSLIPQWELSIQGLMILKKMF